MFQVVKFKRVSELNTKHKPLNTSQTKTPRAQISAVRGLVVTPLSSSGGSYLERYWFTRDGRGRGEFSSHHPTPPSFQSPVIG